MLIFAARRALADITSNKFLHVICIVTIALSVFIVSAFSLFFNNATDFLDAWQKGIRIIVYLEDNVQELQCLDLKKNLQKLDGVSAIEFISKDDAYEDLRQKIGQQSSILEGLDKNPLPDSFEVTLADSFHDLKHIEKIAQTISEWPQVDDVEYAEKWLYRFNGIYNLFKVTGFVLAGVFFIAVLLIIANTIRLIMYARREEIEIVRIIGADEDFIKYPLYFSAVAQGFLGAAAGILLLYLAYILTVPAVAPETVFSFLEIRFISPGFAVAMILGSMIIGWVGCFFSIRKFLKL